MFYLQQKKLVIYFIILYFCFAVIIIIIIIILLLLLLLFSPIYRALEFKYQYSSIKASFKCLSEEYGEAAL
jgi:hypothetical protein